MGYILGNNTILINYCIKQKVIMSKLHNLIEPESLNTRLNEPELLIIDLCNDGLYARKHISGAVHVSPKRLLAGSFPTPNKLPSIEQITAVMNSIGLTEEKHVVAYDDEGGGWAGRFLWTLDVIGHKNWSYLNGGLIAWHNEGLPTTDEVPVVTETQRSFTINRAPIVDIAEIMSSLKNQDLQIWDARSEAEFTGATLFAEKGGHIPGAINCDWTNMMDFKRNQRIRSDALEALENLGLSSKKPTITHCQSHHRSGFTYMLGKILGFDNIRAYDGSWAEWGNHPQTPVEVECNE